MIVFRNTLDLRNCRAISEDQIEALISKLHRAHFEVSALNGTKVDSKFRGVALDTIQTNSEKNGPQLKMK
jgi:hypothetical protein